MDYAARVAFLTTALSIFGWGCKKPPPPPPDAPIDVAFAGCAAVVKTPNGRACELADARTLRLVVPGEDVVVSAKEKPEVRAPEVRAEGAADGAKRRERARPTARRADY